MGVASILSPCILPILPIFAAVSINSKSKSEVISFTLGLFTIFTVIIFLTGLFTSLTYRYLIYVRIISSVLLLIIGFMMLFDRTISFKSISPKNNDGIIGSFIFGVLTSVAWVPCYSGYLISLIALLVNSNNPIYSSLNIFIYCIGFALTLLVLSYALSKINLEKLISKTKYIPKIFAVLIIIGAAYLLISIFF